MPNFKHRVIVVVVFFVVVAGVYWLLRQDKNEKQSLSLDNEKFANGETIVPNDDGGPHDEHDSEAEILKENQEHRDSDDDEKRKNEMAELDAPVIEPLPENDDDGSDDASTDGAPTKL